jgi:hypothetical protein
MKYSCLFMWLICLGCKEYYEPPVLKHNPGLLVVDGFLNSSPDSTYIKLTYTRNLRDTAPAIPALNANLIVEGDQGDQTPLFEIGKGLYGNLLNLNTVERYRLAINTSDGTKYLSEYVPFKQTPPIDSITWEQDSSNVSFFINTHDAQNNTVYYRWQYQETWQYSTYLTSTFDYVHGTLLARTPDQQIHNCWKENSASTILLASTSQLSQDIVYHFPFLTISKSIEKLSVMYSVVVSQYALTRDEFEYWTSLKKNSEQLGTLFDAQPSQLNSNIRCISNPTEPVMGYLSASSLKKKRIFVGMSDMTNLNYVPYYLPCYSLNDVTTGFSAQDTSRAYEYLEMPRHLFTFWYSDGLVYHIAQNFCIDCREHGGTNVKPDFWP